MRRNFDHYKASVFGVLLPAILIGCSKTAPVHGSVQNGTETFIGTATGYLDGAGDLTVTTSTGVTCTGTFTFATGRTGQGVFYCNDGRSGPFTFVSTGSRGSGVGSLGGQTFTFIIG
jgi:hypothetical protein